MSYLGDGLVRPLWSAPHPCVHVCYVSVCLERKTQENVIQVRRWSKRFIKRPSDRSRVKTSIIVIRYTKGAELRLRDHSETKNFPRYCDKVATSRNHSALLLSFIFGHVNREITREIIRDRGFRRKFFFLFIFFIFFFLLTPGLGIKLRRAPFEKSAPKGLCIIQNYTRVRSIWTIISSRYLRTF